VFSGDGLAAYSWAAQEYVKGGTSAAILAMEPSNLVQAGWSFNAEWFIIERYQADGTPIMRLRTATEASSIAQPSLKSQTFFKRWLETDLKNVTFGSAKAAELKVKYDTLARGIPAMSFAAATHSIDGTKGNFDMQGTLRTDSNEWPKEGRTDDFRKDQWLHSDMKDVAFIHVYKLYQQFITTGELNQ
jgi:hypothetical protein